MLLPHKTALLGMVGVLAAHPAPMWMDVSIMEKAIDVMGALTQETEQRRKTLMADASAAQSGMERALGLLDAGKKKQAQTALERVLGTLEIVPVRNSRPKLAPTGLFVLTTDEPRGSSTAKRLRQQIG